MMPGQRARDAAGVDLYRGDRPVVEVLIIDVLRDNWLLCELPDGQKIALDAKNVRKHLDPTKLEERP